MTRNAFTIEVRPAIAKTADAAWPPRDIENLPASDHNETVVVRAADALQRHLKDYDDVDLVNLRRPDGSYFFPDFQTIDGFRR
jgi:hypothetical protein